MPRIGGVVAAGMIVVGLAAGAAALAAQDRKSGAGGPPTTLTFDWPSRARLEVELRTEVVNEGKGAPDTARTHYLLRLGVSPTAAGRQVRLIRIDDLSAGAVPRAAGDAGGIDTLQQPGLEVDSLGRIVAFQRLDSVMVSWRRAAAEDRVELARQNPALMLAFDATLSDARLRQTLEVLWSGLVGAWASATLVRGELLESRDSVPFELLGSGSVPRTTQYLLSGPEACEAGWSDTSCVLLTMQFVLDPVAMAAQLRPFVRAASPVGDPVQVDSMAVTQRIDVLVEPRRLVPHVERMITTTDLRVSSRSEGASRLRQETTHLLYFRLIPTESPLHIAAAAGDADGVVAALAAGEPVDGIDDANRTPLLLAVRSGHDAVARRLLASGADAGIAARAARDRGDVSLARQLYALGGLTPPRTTTLGAARVLRDSLEFLRAIPLLAELAIADSLDREVLGELAHALAMAGLDSTGVRHADALLARDACDRHGLRVRRQFHVWRMVQAAAHVDSARRFVRRAVDCDPASGDAWLGAHLVADRTGDAMAERQAIERLDALAFLTPAQLEYARWVLEAVPRGALLLTSSTVEHAALRVLQVRGVRPDVTVRAMDAVRMPTDAGGRVVAVMPGASIEDPTNLRGMGPYLALTATYDTARTPATAWPQFARMARLAGRSTVAEDPEPFRRRMDLRADIARAAFFYINSIDGPGLWLDTLAIADIDSTSRLMLAAAEGAGYEVTFFRQQYATFQSGIAQAWADRGLPWRAQRITVAAAQVSPTDPMTWNNLAYWSLLVGDLAGADTAIMRSTILGESLVSVLNSATLARLGGRPDSSLVLLARARALLEASAAAGEDTVTWPVLHLPRGRGDTLTVRPRTLLATTAARRALVEHNVALAEALRGNTGAAEAAVARARALADDAGLRCYAVSLSAATRAFARPPRRAEAWLTAHESRLARDAGCGR